MDTQLEPIMSIDVPRAVSGEDILSDLLDRIAERLVLTNSLRAVDCYRRYSAKVVIDLQLDDIDSVAVSTGVQVGSVDPGRPSHHIVLDAPGAHAEQVQESSGLPPASPERFIDGAGATVEAAALKLPRTYVSRIRARK